MRSRTKAMVALMGALVGLATAGLAVHHEVWGLRSGWTGQEGKRVKAPELEGGLGWFNTDKPLTLAGLKGKVVLLDFWTYC